MAHAIVWKHFAYYAAVDEINLLIEFFSWVSFIGMGQLPQY